MKIRNQIVLVTIVACSGGCKIENAAKENSESKQNVATPRKDNNRSLDSWYKPAPKSSIPAEWQQVDKSKVEEVNVDAFPKAERLLREQSFVLLTSDQLKILTGRSINNKFGEKPYLFRSVYYSKESGILEIYYKNTQVWVLQSSLGSSNATMQRGATVVYLPFHPTRTFVECSSAE